MKKILNKAICCLLLSCIAGCSVKEDRAPCPCLISLDMSECVGAGDVIVSVWNDGIVYRRLSSSGEENILLMCEVPKGEVTVSAVSVTKGERLSGSVLEIPRGALPDSVYACVRTVDAKGESAWGRMKLLKQFASVSMDVREAMPPGESARADVKINVCGMDIRDLTAVSGESLFSVAASEDGLFHFCLPRLPDGKVEVVIGNNAFRLDLGVIMRRSGYDWEAPDLADINIRMGPCDGDMGVEIIPWRGFLLEDVVI